MMSLQLAQQLQIVSIAVNVNMIVMLCGESPPANVRVLRADPWRGGLPTDSLPVSALYVLKVISVCVVVHLTDCSFKDDERVSGKEVSDVKRQCRVHAVFKQVVPCWGVDLTGDVIVGVQHLHDVYTRVHTVYIDCSD
jgi:hypothetical protein